LQEELENLQFVTLRNSKNLLTCRQNIERVNWEWKSMKRKLNIWLHPPMNTGEMLGIYELETKYSNQSRASSTWEISSVTPTLIINA